MQLVNNNSKQLWQYARTPLSVKSHGCISCGLSYSEMMVYLHGDSDLLELRHNNR